MSAPSEPRAPGFYPDVPEEQYHADPTSLSVSGAKLLLKAPALYRWAQDHPQPHRAALDFGRAAHAKVTGVGAGVAVIPPTSRAKADQIAHREAKEAAYAEGLTPVTVEEAARIDAMALALEGHQLARRLLTNGQPEVSAYSPDPTTGVMRRCRVDLLNPSVLVDYKTAVSSDPRDIAGRYGAIAKWGYDLQAAWYLDLCRDLGHPARAFAFVFQQKEPPHLVTVAYVDEDELHAARAANRRALELYRDCTETGQWPGYLPDDTAAVVSLTQQTYDTERITT